MIDISKYFTNPQHILWINQAYKSTTSVDDFFYIEETKNGTLDIYINYKRYVFTGCTSNQYNINHKFVDLKHFKDKLKYIKNDILKQAVISIIELAIADYRNIYFDYDLNYPDRCQIFYRRGNFTITKINKKISLTNWKSKKFKQKYSGMIYKDLLSKLKNYE